MAGLQFRGVDLCDGGSSERFLVETFEDLFDRFTVSAFDDGKSLRNRKRWNGVLQLRQFISNIRRQQITPSGQGLAEFNEYWTELFERKPDSFADGRIAAASPWR